jgi:hypothetical protein
MMNNNFLKRLEKRAIELSKIPEWYKKLIKNWKSGKKGKLIGFEKLTPPKLTKEQYKQMSKAWRKERFKIGVTKMMLGGKNGK